MSAHDRAFVGPRDGFEGGYALWWTSLHMEFWYDGLSLAEASLLLHG
jgi:hypothetical protein